MAQLRSAICIMVDWPLTPQYKHPIAKKVYMRSDFSLSKLLAPKLRRLLTLYRFLLIP